MPQIRIMRAIPMRLQALGIDPAEILRLARLPQTLLLQDRVVISHAQWDAFHRALEQLSDDPMLGLKLTQPLPGEPMDALSVTALSAGTFREALNKMVRYKRLFCSEELRIIEHGDICSIDMDLDQNRNPMPHLLVDGMAASLIELARHGTGRALYPLRIYFRRAERHRAVYEEFFHCPIEFSADCNMLVFDRAALDQPFRTYNPELVAMLEPQLETALQSNFSQQQIADQVKMLIRSRLAAKQPSIQDVAGELSISARTLQRRLADEGAHFQLLLETVRREMAQQYMKDASLDLSEIAFLLGYEEASSFHRAFHQWEGVSPGQWRAAHMAGG